MTMSFPGYRRVDWREWAALLLCLFCCGCRYIPLVLPTPSPVPSPTPAPGPVPSWEPASVFRAPAPGTVMISVQCDTANSVCAYTVYVPMRTDGVFLEAQP